MWGGIVVRGGITILILLLLLSSIFPKQFDRARKFDDSERHLNRTAWVPGPGMYVTRIGFGTQGIGERFRAQPAISLEGSQRGGKDREREREREYVCNIYISLVDIDPCYADFLSRSRRSLSQQRASPRSWPGHLLGCPARHLLLGREIVVVGVVIVSARGGKRSRHFRKR